MLTEERLQGIWRIVTEKGSASIQELMDALNISESTVRRDLAVLDEQGRIQKVRGGGDGCRRCLQHEGRQCDPEKG